MLSQDVLNVVTTALAKDRHQPLGALFALIGEAVFIFGAFRGLLSVAD